MLLIPLHSARGAVLCTFPMSSPASAAPSPRAPQGSANTGCMTLKARAARPAATARKLVRGLLAALDADRLLAARLDGAPSSKLQAPSVLMCSCAHVLECPCAHGMQQREGVEPRTLAPLEWARGEPVIRRAPAPATAARPS